MAGRTVPAATLDAAALDVAWSLHPQVAVRPEPFGALLYHFGTRRLTFLKDPALTRAVTTLADHPTARVACTAAGLPTDAALHALSTLAATEMVEPRRPE